MRIYYCARYCAHRDVKDTQNTQFTQNFERLLATISSATGKAHDQGNSNHIIPQSVHLFPQPSNPIHEPLNPSITHATPVREGYSTPVGSHLHSVR